MMKRPEFLETKRTPRYSLRKLNVGVASVLLGVNHFWNELYRSFCKGSNHRKRCLVGLQAQIEALVMTNNLAKFGMLQTSN